MFLWSVHEKMLAWSGGSCGGDEKWSDSGHIPKAEMLGFNDGLDTGNEEKVGIKNGS